MIICPFCRREIMDEHTEDEFFCKYCGNKIVKSELSPANIIEESNPESSNNVPLKNASSDGTVIHNADLNDLAPTLPVAVAPIAACAFSGVLLATRFALGKFISDGRIINLFYTIGFSGLVCSFISGIDEYSKRLNQKNMLLLEETIIDLKYNDFTSAREKIKMIKPRFGMKHFCKVRWETARSLLSIAADRFESRIKVPETGDKSMVKCPFCHKPIAFVPEAYFFCTHCKAMITNSVRKDVLAGTESYRWPSEYDTDKQSAGKKLLLGLGRIGVAFISAIVFLSGIPIFYTKTLISLALMLSGGFSFVLSVLNDPEYKPFKFGLGTTGLERLNSRIINYMLDGDFTSARDFIDAMKILSSARDDNFIRFKTTEYILLRLADKLDDGTATDTEKSS